MFHVYILQSLKNGRYYVGHTDSLDRRLGEHNAGRVHATRYITPLVLVYSEPFEDGTAARQREWWLKSQKSRKLLTSLIHGKP